MVRRRKKFKYFLITLSAGIIIFLAFAAPTFWQLIKQEREKIFLRNYLQQLEAENVQLQKEIEKMEKDPLAIERIARKQLGMLKPGEIEYKFMVTEAQKK